MVQDDHIVSVGLARSWIIRMFAVGFLGGMIAGLGLALLLGLDFS